MRTYHASALLRSWLILVHTHRMTEAHSTARHNGPLTNPVNVQTDNSLGKSLLSRICFLSALGMTMGSRRNLDHSNFCSKHDLTFLPVLMMRAGISCNGYKAHLTAVLRQKEKKGRGPFGIAAVTSLVSEIYKPVAVK